MKKSTHTISLVNVPVYLNDDEGNRVWREFFMSIYSGKQFSLDQYVGDTEFWTAQDSDGKMYLVYKKDYIFYNN